MKITSEKITVKANEIRPGMILAIYGNGERFDVEKVIGPNEYGAVIIINWSGKCRGLDKNEDVEVRGYFNPSGVGKF